MTQNSQQFRLGVIRANGGRTVLVVTAAGTGEEARYVYTGFGNPASGNVELCGTFTTPQPMRVDQFSGRVRYESPGMGRYNFYFNPPGMPPIMVRINPNVLSLPEGEIQLVRGNGNLR